MRPGFRLLLVLAAAAVGGWSAAPGAASQDPSAIAETPEARGVGRVLMAAELAAWGRERASPDALRLAATLLDEVPLRVGRAGDADVEPVLSAAALRREAAELQAARDEVQVSGSRVRPPGRQAPAAPERCAASAPAASRSNVPPNSAHISRPRSIQVSIG